MTEIKWEEPAPRTRGRGRTKYGVIVEQLKRRPGQWAVVAENADASISSYLKSRHGLESVTRGVKNGKAEKIYARWPESA